MKPILSVRATRRNTFACACALALLGLKFQAAATSVFDASYDPNTGNAQTTGSYTLDPFTVTGFYTSNSTTTESVFITDGTAGGRIYGSDSLFTGMTVGSTYTATVTDSVYQLTEEFKTPTGIAAAGMLSVVTPMSVSLAQIQNTAPIAASPSDPNYAATGALLFAPVSFTITPNASGTLSTSATTILTDTATGDAVTLFRSASALPYTAGTTYTVVAYETPYQGNSEIVGAISITPMTAAPEPSTYALLGLGGLTLAMAARRKRAA